MKKILIFFILLFLSCSQKEVQLPKVVWNKKIEMKDFSVIYIFFNEKTQKAELNRTNLITSTNWIFHIDKRNLFAEAAQAIEVMQEKKGNPKSPHNNPNSRIYFSIAEKIKNKLNFIDFTATRFRLYNSKKMKNEIVEIRKEGFFLSNKKILLSEIIQKKYNTFLCIQKMYFQDFIEMYVELLKNGVIPSEIIFKNGSI